MSFDVLLRGFRNGEAVGADPTAATRILSPHFVAPPDDFFVRVVTSDGGRRCASSFPGNTPGGPADRSHRDESLVSRDDPRMNHSMSKSLALFLPFALLPLAAHAAEPAPAVPPATAASMLEALHLPEVTEMRLENGLRVVLEENHQAPFVAMQLRYGAGSRDEVAGKEGLASVTQRMMTARTKHVPAGEYDATLDRIGAFDYGRETTLDAVSEWATLPSNALDSVLWLWSDQMGFFEANDPKDLAEALASKAKERVEKVTGAAKGAVPEIVQSALYPKGHPYHLAPRAEASTKITLDDVRAFHDDHLAPNDAVLVLAGDFQTATILDEIRTYFGPIAPGPAPQVMIEPAQLDEEVRLDVVANVKAAEVWMDWRTPPFFAAGDAELDVAARAMIGNRVAVLRWELVDRQRVATRVSAHQASRALGSDFRITATVADGHTPDEVVAAIDRVLKLAEERGLNEESLAGARANTIIPYAQGLDRASRRCATYTGLAMAHRDPKRIFGDVGRYDAVTSLSTRATMVRWLTKEHRVVTVITPDPSAPLSGILRATRGAK